MPTVREIENARKEEKFSSRTRPGARRRSCSGASRPSRRCGPTSRSACCTRSSASRPTTPLRARKRCGSSCGSPNLKSSTGACMPLSSTTSMSTPRFTSSLRPLISEGGCRPTLSTTARERLSPDNSKGSSASSRPGRAARRWRAPRRRASGSSTSGRGSSAAPSGSRLSSTRHWIARSRSPSSSAG